LRIYDLSLPVKAIPSDIRGHFATAVSRYGEAGAPSEGPTKTGRSGMAAGQRRAGRSRDPAHRDL